MTLLVEAEAATPDDRTTDEAAAPEEAATKLSETVTLGVLV
jgi:hypothetical protein